MNKTHNMIKKLVRYFLWVDIGMRDLRGNSVNLLLLKAIFGALRPWWRVAYDRCKDGSDFNVPELWFDQSDDCYRGFTDTHNDLITEFCTAVADVLGYCNADELEEEKWHKKEMEKMGIGEIDEASELYFQLEKDGYINKPLTIEDQKDCEHPEMEEVERDLDSGIISGYRHCLDCDYTEWYSDDNEPCEPEE
tara:strand:- start:2309 stop:2887 length:579 start_codon:yes stop_codon:yes gene_type:complete